MESIKNKINSFLKQSYGIDNLGRFMLVIYAVLCILNAFLRSIYSNIIAIIIIVLFFIRTFSKNHVRRSAENRKYLEIKKSVFIEFKLIFDRIRYIKDSRFRKCKHCRAIVKLPNKCGKHTVKCPKCGEKFDVNILI